MKENCINYENLPSKDVRGMICSWPAIIFIVDVKQALDLIKSHNEFFLRLLMERFKKLTI